MKILLVYPQYPDTFWSFRHALRIISKKAAYPPLGLLTVAAMLPSEWEKKLVDMNVTTLSDEDIKWADYVFISAMVVQRDSVEEVISRCNRLNAPIVAGGPLFTTGYDEFEGVDHFVLGEADIPVLDGGGVWGGGLCGHLTVRCEKKACGLFAGLKSCATLILNRRAAFYMPPGHCPFRDPRPSGLG